jgi:hypothetical protein
MLLYRVLFFYALLVNAAAVNAQSSVTIKATSDKNKILLGEPIILTIEASFPSQAAISFIAIDTIPHFEFLEKPAIDTTTQNNTTIIKRVYKLTSFDSGHWVIPAFILSPSAKTDTIPVDVVFAEFDARQDYHDIKDVLNIKPAGNKTPWWWYVAGALLLAVLLLIYFLQKGKKKEISNPPVFINAFEEAMEKLMQLRKQPLPAKEYYGGLTDIFRQYIFKKKEILSLQKTTGDLLYQIKQLNFPKEQYDKLAQALSLCDFVKFAKYVPAREDEEVAYNDILNAIKAIESTSADSSAITRP